MEKQGTRNNQDTPEQEAEEGFLLSQMSGRFEFTNSVDCVESSD
jgi:hypothetical protein